MAEQVLQEANLLKPVNIVQSKNVLADLKSNPEQFIAKVVNYDPVNLRNVITLLEGLRATSNATKNRIIEAMEIEKDILVQELDAELTALTNAINTLEVV